MKRRIWQLAIPIVGVALCAVGLWAWGRETRTPTQLVQIVTSHPHDERAFTQGLTVRDGVLYESTGLYGESSIRAVDVESGNPLRSVPVHESIFAEGMTLLNGELFFLSWKNGTAYVLDPKTFEFSRSFGYGGEGWGLTDDGRQLILSDGSAYLRFLDPQSGRVLRRLPVRSDEGLIDHLNELEWIKGEIWANIWYQDRIARISPETGEVLGWIDASVLRQHVQLVDPKENVLNGIAFDAEKKVLYLTGKRWPKLFEVRVGDGG